MEIAQAASITGQRGQKPVIQPSRCYAGLRSNWLKQAPMVSPRDVTALLGDWSRGNRTALNQLLPLVYAELRRVAARQLRNERADHTLQPTALVHEVYIRLVDQRQVDWQNRAHFFGVAAQVMRRILVDHARRHGASKRGDGVRCVSIDEAKDVAASTRSPSSRWIRRSIAWKRSTLIWQDRRASCVWRTDDRGSGTRSERVTVDRQARLAHRESVAQS